MSRYNYQGKEDYLLVIVGWDNPLQTFFAQVWDVREDLESDPSPILWVGTRIGEVSSVEHLDSLLAPFGEIPKEVEPYLRNRI
jgi:hypothetical protein